MPQLFTTVDLANIRTFLSRLSPMGHAEQELLLGLVNKIDKQLAKGSANGISRTDKARTAA
jgi:hypothetical protein